MILRFIEKHWNKNSCLTAFLTGISFTLFSILISYLLFKNNRHMIGITSIFFTVLLLMPLLFHILKKEEICEKRLNCFFKKNNKIIDFYLYIFIGSFLIFFLFSIINPNLVFSRDNLNNINDDVSLNINLPPPSVNNFVLTKNIFLNNVFIIFIAFIISLIFGAGSIFIIILNASMSAYVLAQLIVANLNLGILNSLICNSSVFGIYLIPEMLGFIISAIAGGILYVDFSKEKLFSRSFNEIFKDSFLLFLIAIFCIFFSAIIEVFISMKLFNIGFCKNYPLLLFFVLLILVILILIFEIKRKKGALSSGFNSISE